MIRWGLENDLPELVRVMQEARMGCEWYTYLNMDGLTLVDEDEGGIRGYVRFTLGRPETYVRQLVVHPEHQGNGMVAKRLMLKVIELARAYGSQGLEGSHRLEDIKTMHQSIRSGAIPQDVVRVRWPLTPIAQQKAAAWYEKQKEQVA